MQKMFISNLNPNQEKSLVMNQSSKIHFFATGALALVVLVAPSVQAGLGDPSGITQVTVPSSTTSVMGTPYARPVVAFGTVAATSPSGSNTILTVEKDPSSSDIPAFTNTDLNVDQWYVVEIVDGPAIGLILNAVGGTGNTSITVEGLVPASINIESGSKFAVRKAWTLSSLFGAASASNPFGSGLSSTATGVNAQVQVLTTSTGGLTSYFIHASGGNYNWRATTASANRNHVPIGLGKGFVIVNRKAVPFNYNLAGDYRTARTRLIVPGGKRILLSNPGLFDVSFDRATIPATSPTRANTIPGGSHDGYGIWSSTTRSFNTFRIGGVTQTNGASAFTGGTRTNPVIAKFTSLLATPAGTGDKVVTIAPAFTANP
jgi:hypothetical protein